MKAKILVKVLNLDDVPDSAGEVIVAAGVEMPAGTVPVQYEFSEKIRDQLGQATVERRDDGIYANIEIYGHWADDIEKMAKARLLYPAVGGVTFEKSDGTIHRCRITRISLGSGNADSRIEPIWTRTP